MRHMSSLATDSSGRDQNMEENKKKIAALTAVLYHLQAEEEAARQAQLPATPAPPAPEGFWSFSGRQSQMMLRSMAQMRLFPGWKG
jgi:hypothetical protein